MSPVRSSDSVAEEKDTGEMSVRAAVRKLESLGTELKCLTRKTRDLRECQRQTKEDVTEFMRTRNLERLGTRDGRVKVRVCERSTRRGPSKPEVVEIINDVLKDDPELRLRLMERLYDGRVQKRTTTVVSISNPKGPTQRR